MNPSLNNPQYLFLQQLQQYNLLQWQWQYLLAMVNNQNGSHLQIKQEPIANDSQMQSTLASTQIQEQIRQNNQNQNIDDESIEQQNMKIGKMKIQANELTLTKRKSLRQEIEDMIQIILDNVGINNSVLDGQYMSYYKTKGDLQQIYQQFIQKYRQQRRTKEMYIKYILRIAFKFLFKTYQRYSDKNLSLQRAHRECMEHYFKGQNFGDLDVLPFRKNSKNKTMNQEFLRKIFSSQTFVNDYKIFLERLDSIIEEGNKKKILNIATHLCEFNNQQETFIKSMRRAPWPLQDLNQSKQIAYELLEFTNLKNEKKQKI